MREIAAKEIATAVAALLTEANYHLPEDVRRRLRAARAAEDWPPAAETLGRLIENFELADAGEYPICQDTGLACVFVELGQEVHIAGDLQAAVDDGVRAACKEGFLRASSVRDPLRRVNTGDNTPAVLYLNLVPGDRVAITVAPKGFGSENMSRVEMLRPSDGVEGVRRFVLDTVERAGGNPCPPIVVGVGIGGTFDRVAELAKRALLRPLDAPHPDPFYASLERELLAEINKSGIGPQGFGGRTTALGVAIEGAPTHIAGLPCAVNINCHVQRHASCVL